VIRIFMIHQRSWRDTPILNHRPSGTTSSLKSSPK